MPGFLCALGGRISAQAKFAKILDAIDGEASLRQNRWSIKFEAAANSFCTF